MNRKSIVLLVILTFASISVFAQQPDPAGRKIYKNNCARCHGTRGLFGAKNLQMTKLNDNELYNRIVEGKGIMPSWKNKLTAKQIDMVISYVRSLRSTYNQQ